MTQTYSQEQLQEILQLAIARHDSQGEFTQGQLVEIAQELGISLQTLQEAEQEWQRQKELEYSRQAFDLYLKDKFRQKTINALLLAGFFLAIDLLTGSGITWSRYILLLSGFAIAWNAWKTFQPKGEAYEKAFQRWESKRQLQQTVKDIWTSVQNALKPM
ncbi:MAG: 2TM domain-containing protein [Kamptonema sp. SIO4C4]|nr:2TM domain-containing protein [Kamptonema sp. SIO4C4]